MTMERKRIPAQGREALNAMFAIHSVMGVYEGWFKSLCERVPNGWRDFRLLQSKLAALLDKLLDTVPLDQLKAIKAHMEISTIHLGVKGVKPKDYWLMTYDDLATLAEYATKTECFACTRTDKPCELRDVLKQLPIQGVEKIIVGCWEED